MEELIEYFNTQGITDPRVQANIIAQIQRESGGIPKTESLNYSPERALEIFPKYFKDLEDAKTVLAQGPEAFAHRIYGNRKKLGNESNDPNEAYKYRGRGLIQLTGRGNYEKYGKLLGIDLVNNPELANDPVIAQKIATSYYLNKGKGKDLSDINVVNKLTGFVDKGGEGQKRIELADKIFEDIRPQDVKARGVGPFEAQLQAAENEGKKLFPTYGAPKVEAAPAVSPNFNVAGGYNPNKAPENVMSQYGKGPREVIKETETITEEGPGFIDRIKSGFEELYPFNEGGPVKNTNNFPNFYANENITPPRDGTYTLLPEEIITPYQDDTIMEEEIITQPPQYSMQEAARRSMMLGNKEQRMADYENAQYNPQQNSSYALPQMQAAQRMMGGGMGYAQGGTVDQAQGLASLGRGGDSTLVHMQPQEVAGLQQLAQANGTSLTRNPMTGYPEAFSLKGALKAALPIAAGYFLGPAAGGLMTGTTSAGYAASGAIGGSIAAGAATGAAVAAGTGEDPIMGAVSGGLGGMSGGNLNTAFGGAGVPEAFGGASSSTIPRVAGNSVPYAGGELFSGAPSSIAPSFSTTTADAGSVIGSGSSGLDANVGGPAGGYNSATNSFSEVKPGNLFTRQSNVPMGEKLSVNLRSKVGDGFDPATGNLKYKYENAGPMKIASTLGAPVASMGLGGLEASDFINEPDFNDPRDKYDPRSKLDLSRDTGISEAMSRDTGLRLLAKGGYLQGPGDGMSDDIPATINGDEPAALADGEFVVPADVVSHLGNGSSEAGSKQLYAMMARIRNARTGRKSQGKEIKPGKYMPR